MAHEQELAARELEAARRERECEELECLEALAAPVLEVCDVSEALARAHLLAGGYHKHKGEWRRERSV